MRVVDPSCDPTDWTANDITGMHVENTAAFIDFFVVDDDAVLFFTRKKATMTKKMDFLLFSR